MGRWGKWGWKEDGYTLSKFENLSVSLVQVTGLDRVKVYLEDVGYETVWLVAENEWVAGVSLGGDWGGVGIDFLSVFNGCGLGVLWVLCG
jgi:hypothetical protein